MCQMWHQSKFNRHSRRWRKEKNLMIKTLKVDPDLELSDMEYKIIVINILRKKRKVVNFHKSHTFL